MIRACSAVAFALCLVLAWGSGAEAESRQNVAVKVVEVAGGRAYLTPGEAAGIKVGSVVVFREGRYRVVATTHTHSVIEIKPRELRPGQSGRALAVSARTAVASLSRPKPLSAYENVWPDPVLPATEQQPDYVPLGSWSEDDRIDLALSADVGGTIVLREGDSFGRAALRAGLHAEPFEQPFFFDVDLAVQSWFGGDIQNRDGSSSRPIVRVRELQMGYGTLQSAQAALGRIPFVAVGVGQLDGIRVRSPAWAGFSIGAFGGVVPEPLDNRPTTDTTRFGAELAYQNPELDAQPFVALSVHGSTFFGEIDERRLNAEFDLFPGNAFLGGHFELSLHDEDNPWQAPRAEVSAAGLAASVRIGLFQIAGRFDMRLPERSLWLTSYLPLGYLCNTAAPDPMSDELICVDSNDHRYFGGVDLSLTFSKVALHGGASIVHSQTDDQFDQLTGYLQARFLRIGEIGWADVSVAAYAWSFISDYAARLGLGVDIRQRGEISAYYRASINQYDASPDAWLQHSAGGIFYLSLREDLDLGLRADGIFGEDVRVLVLGSNLTWRPSW
ncbi:MAG: hypothetical protein AMJ62_08935 [Myxococcales bacterium SG8_38]|nr:MAG: hypothetical protein AMJ62_08935 [Myxococcales bacterium SG8_38]